MYHYNKNTYPTHAAAKEQLLKDVEANQEGDIVSVNEDTEGHSLYRTCCTIYTIDKE